MQVESGTLVGNPHRIKSRELFSHNRSRVYLHLCLHESTMPPLIRTLHLVSAEAVSCILH